MSQDLAALKLDFEELRDSVKGKKRIKSICQPLEEKMSEYLQPWYAFSKESEFVYPSQGLLFTPFDYLDCKGTSLLPQEVMVETLRMRMFFLEMFNHPYRLNFLKEESEKPFTKIPKVESLMMENIAKKGIGVSIGDLAATITGSERERISRTERYAQGPFVKLGKYARTPFVGSSSPDIWNSAAAIATMAASHSLVNIPRNGLTSSLDRQVDLAEEVFDWLKEMSKIVLADRKDKNEVLNMWKRNVMGTIDASPDKALVRAKALYEVGVKAFRVYSPEPGVGPVTTVKALRKEFGNDIEIFTGQIVDVEQAKRAEEAGADGLYVGIGGGGRCITGVRSGSAIDWPELIWNLRGEIGIPTIVEGGASDHIAVTFLLGATGIGVSRVVGGGTIEAPGGALFCLDSEGKLFKPYGGEASARTKYLDGKLLPFNIPSFVEGETTRSQMSYIKHVRPTLTYNLHLLIEDAILALVFRGAEHISDLHKLNPLPLKRISSSGSDQQKTH